MGWAVLVRAANVGGRVFRPSELVGKLTDLRLVSLGAAGTFAAAGGASGDEVRRSIARALPFPAEIFVLPAARWHAYVQAHAAALDPPPAGARRYLTVVASPIASPPPLPLHFPTSAGWGVTIVDIDGPFLSGWYRRLGTRMLYPNAVIEREFGVPATTRWWETALALEEALRSGTSGGSLGRPAAARSRRAATRASPGARGRAGSRAG